MALIRFTSALKNYFPDLKEEVIDAGSVSELMEKIEDKYPGIVNYILDEGGRIRGHVSMFIGDEVLPREEKLNQALEPDDKVLIYQAISGG